MSLNIRSVNHPNFYQVSSDETYAYTLCPQCSAHIYNYGRICGLCDVDDITPEEQSQLDYYIGDDPEDFDAYLSDPDQYE